MRRILFLTLSLSFHLMEACKEYYTRLDDVKKSPLNFLFIGTTGITKRHLPEGKPKAEVSQTIANAVPPSQIIVRSLFKSARTSWNTSVRLLARYKNLITYMWAMGMYAS